MRLRVTAVAAACAVCLASTPLTVMAQSQSPSDDFAAAEANLDAANEAFAFALLNEIASEEPGRNIFMSPFSVSTAMQMVYEGAAGMTKSEIRDTLKTGAIPDDQLTAAWEQLDNSLTLQTLGRLDFADGMWYDKSFHVYPAFARVIQNNFEAQLAPIDFSDPAAPKVINQWVSERTQGRINDIVPTLPAGTALVLANAIYFKANWLAQFDKSLTKPRDFYLPDGTVKQTPMMSKQGDFMYAESDDFQVVQLPYASGRMQMTIVLPKKHRTPQQLLADFSDRAWTTNHPSIFSASSRKGTLALPKFKLDYSIRLNEPLERLGIKQAFDPAAADLSPMGDGPGGRLFISLVKQKSYVDVNEEGTEAASATIVAATLGAEDQNPPPPFQMIVNRPFLFIINAYAPPYESPMILFIGVVNDPAAE